MDIKNYMQEAVSFAKKVNPIWPFAALIIDNNNKNILIKTTDCAHISPLFHAESLALHILVTKSNVKSFNTLTMVTTAECDVLSMSSIYWARVVHDIEINRICYGVPLKKINDLWHAGIDISSKTIIEKSKYPELIQS